MYFSPTVMISTLLFFILSITASPIKPRDNACTACQAIFQKVQTDHPSDIFTSSNTCPAPTLESKTNAFNTEICDTFSASDSPNGFGAFVNEYCHAFVTQWGQQLFDYLLTDDNPQDVCVKFKGC